jgi:class 3 adenylate cyclase
VEEAINFARNVQSTYKDKFRFGMHIGTITRRPTGFCNVRDNYFGEAINIASRMESKSKPGHILVTNIVAQHLQLDENDRSQIDCKGIGLVMSSLIRL